MRKGVALFLSCARVGALTFGGGYAMLPFLHKELVSRHGWLKEEDLVDYFALSQCLPGPIAINTATLCGNKVMGVGGGLIASAGIIFPALCIIIVIAALLGHYQDIPAVKNAFVGIRAGVMVLILKALIQLSRSSLKNAVSILICVASFALTVFTNASPVLFVVGAAIVGMALSLRKKARE